MIEKDREILRALACHVAEIAASDRMGALRKEWKMHNSLRGSRPMVCVSPEGAWREIIGDQDLLCQGELERSFEYSLRQKLYWAEELRDDTPVSENFNVPYATACSFFVEDGANNEKRVSDTGSFHYRKLLNNLEDDLQKLRFRELTLDRGLSSRWLETAEAAFGDILRVRHRGTFWWTLGITAEVIKLIGLEDMMMDMYDDPEGLHRLMAWFRDEHLNFIGCCGELGILTMNNEDDIIASGGIGYTDELAQKNSAARLSELWGFAESQETVGISPQMFGEFIFPYQLPLLEKFGLNCYGCCEPVEARWEWVRQIPRLRRISVSPWSDKEKMAELLGKNYIYSRKPNPSYICSGFNEAEIKKELDAMARIAPCTELEVILKDTHTVENRPERLCRWVEMARRSLS